MARAAAVRRRFAQVDVFSAAATAGNPLAVVIDAEGLDQARMAAFARWTNLSETTFLLPATDGAADYRVRIFTPGGELPFAGHPTLGSAHAWLQAGYRPRAAGELVQECGVGLVRLRRQQDRLAFAAPPLLRAGPAEDTRTRVGRALRLDPARIQRLAWVDNGPGWLGVQLADAATVLALRPDFSAFGDLRIGVCGLHPEGSPEQLEVRAFVPGLGVPEDPVTGSLNAGLALWLIDAGVLPAHYVAAQGSAIGRSGRVHVDREGPDTWVGGQVTTVVTGQLEL